MKMPINNQQGSTHVLVVIVLVAVLIFALGWIFWQNFIYKETPQQGSVPATKQDDKSQTDQSQNQGEKIYLAINEYGVKIPLSAQVSDAVYHINKENGIAYLSTKKLDMKSELGDGEGCGVVAIVRGQKGQVKDEIPGEGTPSSYFGDGSREVKIGNYYYTWVGGNGMCTADYDLEAEVKTALITAAEAITAQ